MMRHINVLVVVGSSGISSESRDYQPNYVTFQTNNMPVVSRIEGLGGKKQTVELSVDLYREFTEDEKDEFYSVVQKLWSMINRNNLLTDEKYMGQIKDDNDKILALFGDEKIYTKQIPNGYHDSYVSPWFIVTTRKGQIEIGWRKRVISIDWKDSDIKKSGFDLFPNEDTTRWDTGIHAWGYEKAKEYINVLLNS
jgi:hypothetical protein